MRKAYSLIELTLVIFFVGIVGSYIFKFLGYILIELEYSKESTKLAQNSFRVMELIKFGSYTNSDISNISGMINLYSDLKSGNNTIEFISTSNNNIKYSMDRANLVMENVNLTLKYTYPLIDIKSLNENNLTKKLCNFSIDFTQNLQDLNLSRIIYVK